MHFGNRTISHSQSPSTPYLVFVTVLIGGILVKYNYAAIWIYNVPVGFGLLVRSAIVALLVGYLAAPLFRARRGRSLLLGVAVVYTAFFLSNFYYNRYFGNYLSYNDILMGQGVRPFRVVARQLFRPADVLSVIDVLVLVYVWYRLRHRDRTTGVWPLLRGELRRRRVVLLAVPLLLAGQIAISNQLLGGPTPRELYNASTAGYAGVYGILPLYGYEIFRYHNPVPESSIPAPAGNAAQQTDETEVVLTEEGAVDTKPNIIMIQVESLDAKLIGYEFNGREVTPFLNDLKDQSLYGSEFYAQHVNGSFDAEFAALASLYPPNKTYAFRNNDMGAFDSIVRVLNDNGYETIALHPNDASFFHRHKAYPELGFDRFYSRKDFDEAATVYEVERTSFGINDYDFFAQALDYIQSAPEPFFSFLITVTSHTAFDFYPDSFSLDAFADATPPLLRDYLNSAAFVDHALEMFFSALDARRLDRNTLVVLYGDHDAAVQSPTYTSRREFTPQRPLREHPEHVPLFILHDDVAPGVISKTATTTDIAPTVLDLIGADSLPGDFVGSSLLHPEEEPVLFLHEVPQLLYKDHLFALELTGENGDYHVTEVGQLPHPREAYVEISDEQKEEALEIIQFTRQIITNRRP